MNIAIFGAGAWGTAMAIHLARLNHRVTLVPRRMEHALELASSRENKDYLPDCPLDQNIQIGCEIFPAIMEADVAVLACPSHGLRELCERIKPTVSSARQLQMVIALCKGVEKETFLKPAEVIRRVLPEIRVGVLSGPTFAGEVAEGKPTAMSFATHMEDELAVSIQEAFSSELLRVYRTTDVIGVELGGCLKNVYAIGAGICDGLALGDNAKAAYLTRALHEMVGLGAKLGGLPATFYGLSGFGDLFATCNGKWSRNRTFGQSLAEGESAQQQMENRKTVVEGYYATENFFHLCKRQKHDAPILSEIFEVVFHGADPKAGILRLMRRELKPESN